LWHAAAAAAAAALAAAALCPALPRRTCGICSHYRPRSNPDCVAVTIYCIDPSAPLKVVAVKTFDGQHWEQSYADTNIGKLASSV